MWTIRRILVPTDLSDAAERAFQYALDLAATHGASVTILNASDARLRGYYPDGFEADRAAMEKLVAENTRGNVEVKITQRDGPAAEAISRAVQELGMDLIVMGTHGRGALGGAILGSVANEVVRTADVPVLTIRTDAR